MSIQELRQSIDSSLTRDDSFSKKTQSEQKITIDKRHYNRLLNFLKSASNINLENKGIIIKSQYEELGVQTDIVKEKEVLVEDNSETLEILRFENKTHVESLKQLNDSKKELLEQISTSRINIKRLEETIEKLNSDIAVLKNDLNDKDMIINSQTCEIARLEKINKKNVILTNRRSQDEGIKGEIAEQIDHKHPLNDKVMI
jgi:hypothetical protein